MSFASSITYLGEDYRKADFPERFSNQIYISRLRRFEPYAYKSNFSIKFTVSGLETYRVNGRMNVLKKNQLLIVNDDSDVEGMHDTGNEFTTGLSIFLESQIISEVYRNTQLIYGNDVPHPDERSAGKIDFFDRIISDDAPLLQYMQSLVTSSSSLDELTYVGICEQLTAFKFRFENKLLRTRKLKRSTQIEICHRVQLAERFLSDTLFQKFDLERVANEACLSKYFLIRAFRDVYGMTPQQYHCAGRIEKARQFLKQGFSLSDTAESLGFPNIYYFSRQFKQYSGQSPGRFRDNEQAIIAPVHSKN